MSIVLKMGVVDLPYSNGKTTTGDVAEILENKYGVMGYFWELNKFKIVNAVEGALEGALETILMGGQVTADPFLAGTSDIEAQFQHFLDSKQMDGKVGGVPTAASLKGVSHRFKRKRGPPRPSFIDTALYEHSFKCWVEV